MKVAVLGANWSPCAELMDQTVVPATGLPSPSVQVKAVPPHSWTSIPRCRLYQAWSAGASLALKKMPPMPVTRFIEPPRVGWRFCLRGSQHSCSIGKRYAVFHYRSVHATASFIIPATFGGGPCHAEWDIKDSVVRGPHDGRPVLCD